MEGSIKRLVVCGASGNVGLPVVQAALARGIKVLAVCRNPDKITIKNENLTTVAVDLSKDGALLEVLHPDDTVVFCAYMSEGSQESSFKNTFKAVEEKGIQRIVYTGGVMSMKIDDEQRVYDLEDIKKNYAAYAKNNRMQTEFTAQSKLNWTEVDFGMVIAGSKTPESKTTNFYGKDVKLVEFTEVLEDVEYVTAPTFNFYVMSEVIANKIIDVASKQVFLRQHVAYNNGLYAPKRGL